MLRSKIRTTIIVLTAAGVASGTAVPAVASAAATAKKPGSATQINPIKIKPIVVAHKMEAGSAGIPGYGDATCQSLLNDYNTAVTASEQALLSGASTNQSGELANRIYGQLTDNCLVVNA